MAISVGLHPSFHAGFRKVARKLAVLTGILLVVWLAPMPQSLRGIAGYEPLHTLLETFSIVVSGLIFAVIWNAFEHKRDRAMLLLACGYIGVALLDFSHMLSIKGMPVFVTPSDPEKAIDFWFAARLLAALSLLLVASWWGQGRKLTGSRYLPLAGVLVVVAVAHWVFLWHGDWTPRTFIPGQGLTPFKVGVEYFLIALNVLAVLLLWRRMRGPLPFNAPSLLGALVTTALSEFYFTLYGDVGDIFLVMGHVYKIVAYMFLYQAVFVETMSRPFYEIRDLKESLDRTQELAALGSWELDLVANKLTWSDEVYRLFGLHPQEFPATYEAFLERVHPDDRDLVNLSYSESLRLGQSEYDVEHRIIRKSSGEVRYVHEKCQHMRDSRGAVLRSLGMVHDITERKQAELSMQLGQARLAGLVESAMDAIVSVDGAHNIVLFNPAAERMFLYKAEEMVGQPLNRLLPAGVRATHSMHLHSFATSGTSSRTMGGVLQVKGCRSNGEEFPVEASISQVKVGKDTIFTTILRDVTERAKAQQALLKANAELSRSNADLEQFAYAASHDLQEPLRSVSSCVQLLKKRYAGTIDARADEFIDHAVSGSQRMQALIDDLLRFSRVNTAAREFAKVDTGAVLGRVMADLALAIDEAQAAITHDAMPVVLGDASQLGQLFQNLLSNAIKFRGDKPAQVHVAVVQDAVEWRFCVTDHGIGIAPEYFDRIFKLFHRLHTREEYAGTGIGLTLCKKIVERHGGRIWVDSEPGVRTSFCFTLPKNH